MERIKGINQGRIAWCCEDSHISLERLALEAGISESSLYKVMNGEGGLTFNQLKKIADFFGRGVLFFLEDGLVSTNDVHTPAFRTIENQKPEIPSKLRLLIERAERQRDIYLSLRDELYGADEFSFSAPPLPDDIDEAASKTRSWLGLNNENSFERYRSAIEAKGILVFRSNGYNGKWQIAKESPILGFSLYDTVCPIIFVKKQFWETRQTFTLMHELGHLLLHKKSSIDDDNDLISNLGPESEANAFAGRVLVPEHFLKHISDHQKPDNVSDFDSWLERPRRSWGVSTEVILRRLLDCGRIGQDEYSTYRAWRKNVPIPESDSGTRMYRYREPKNIFGDTFVRTVLDSLNAKNITLSKASTYLDSLKINDLHSLEQFYAGH